MASGLPLLASTVGGGVELIEDGTSGLLLPPAAPERWATAIQSVLSDDAGRRRMGEAARERILRSYTIEAMTRQTVDVYEIAMDRLAKDG
jgi:glycosyltransferase involved in cell wall biosynthesis